MTGAALNRPPGGDRAALGSGGPVDYDDAPLRLFHLRVAAASAGGVFCDGFDGGSSTATAIRGWISGANLQSTPRDPFILLTTDGGKTWRDRPIFEETRVAMIERFWFESGEKGSLLIDARLDNNLHEFYETRTGGESWSMKLASASPIPFPPARDFKTSGLRVRADAATHSFDLEKSDGARWQKVASFLVNVGACKQ